MKLSDIYPPSNGPKGKSPNSLNAGPAPMNSPNPTKIKPSATAHLLRPRLRSSSKRTVDSPPAFDAVRLGTAGAVRQAIPAWPSESAPAISTTNNTSSAPRRAKRRSSDRLSQRRILRPLHRHPRYRLFQRHQQRRRSPERRHPGQPAGPLLRKMLQLVTTVSNPMVPPEVRSTALKISAATSELIDRIIRTFEQFKDPEIFVVDPSDEIEQAQESADAQNMMQLAVASGMLGGGEGGNMADQGMPGQAGAGSRTTAPTTPCPTPHKSRETPCAPRQFEVDR